MPKHGVIRNVHFVVLNKPYYVVSLKRKQEKIVHMPDTSIWETFVFLISKELIQKNLKLLKSFPLLLSYNVLEYWKKQDR